MSKSWSSACQIVFKNESDRKQAFTQVLRLTAVAFSKKTNRKTHLTYFDYSILSNQIQHIEGSNSHNHKNIVWDTSLLSCRKLFQLRNSTPDV
jgi:hypothetical protein